MAGKYEEDLVEYHEIEIATMTARIEILEEQVAQLKHAIHSFGSRLTAIQVSSKKTEETVKQLYHDVKPLKRIKIKPSSSVK